MTPILLTLAAFNVAVAGFYTFAAIRYRRALTRIRVLDVLLTHLCAQACLRDHEPVWLAWGAAMGSYEVQLRPCRREWAEGVE